MMTFKEPVLLLRNENISGPAGMALNCAPLFQIPGHAPVGQCPGSQLIRVTPLIKIHWKHTAEVTELNIEA